VIQDIPCQAGNQVEFDCGAFRSGQLFEDTTIGGRWRERGDPVTRADLFP
jgi:hypothetical protein